MGERRIEHDIFDRPVRDTINQKQKGNRNEVACANWWSDWSDVQFVRTPSSGGRRLKNNSMFCGDIVCGDEYHFFPFAVETKFLKSVAIPVWPKPLHKRSKFFSIWEQTIRDARRAGKKPLSMVRVNGMPADEWYLVLSEEDSRRVLHDVRHKFSGWNGKHHIFGFSTKELREAMTYAKFCSITKS